MHQLSILCICILIFLTGCINKKNKRQDTITFDNNIHQFAKYEGNFVSDMYNSRDEGYDWVSVSAKFKNDSLLHFSVRSRADLKKPTCTFDADGKMINDSTFRVVVENKKILFTFQKNTVRISPESKSDENILYYSCSGGASLEGVYTKIVGEVDQKQIDKTVFEKMLELQGIRFYINQTKDKKGSILTIEPAGLEIRNDKETMTIEENVTNAEIEDLNSDGSPELLIYIYNEKTNKGDVIGFSVNNKKSMSQIYFPPIEYDQKASIGYKGFDEFTIIETSLVRRFPIFENNKKTTKMKQIRYKLAEGEALRKFVIDKIIEL